MISYIPLWHLLVERKMSQADLRKKIDIAPNTLTRMKANENVSMDVLNRICEELKCDYKDIVTYIPDANTHV